MTEKTSPEDILQPEAIELIAERSTTALQIHEHLAKVWRLGTQQLSGQLAQLTLNQSLQMTTTPPGWHP